MTSPDSPTMFAQIIRSYGGPTVFETATVPIPEPGTGQVLVRQQATSVNPVDYKIRQDGPPISPLLPAVLGCDVSGIILALGPDVSGLQVGDAVYGSAGGVLGQNGAYAEQIVAEARFLAKRPTLLSARESAALPLVSITAWEGLQRAGVAEGKSVLIRGGVGGVGHIAIQLAKIWGAEVTTTVSSAEKAKIVKDLGADHVINYREDDMDEAVARITGGKGFDIVFDATGGSDLEPAFQAAKLNGQVSALVSMFAQDLTTMHIKGLSLNIVFMLIPMLNGVDGDAQAKILDQVRAFVDGGRLKPLIDANTFGLDDMAVAHALAESGKALGKIVVDIAP